MTTTLKARLRERIQANGPLTVAEYMTACLDDAADGYYRRREPFGRHGDFITAPEVSQMFGELLGLWCAEVWRQQGEPDPALLVEIGPGRGTLMADALRAIERALPAFLAAAKLHLVEISPRLVDHQRQRLQQRPVVWHRHIEDLPQRPILLLANEMFDALPVRQFVRRGAGFAERMVDLDPADGGFVFTERSMADPPPDCRLPAESDLSEGDLVEVSAPREAMARRLAARVAANGGAALIVDYGPATCTLGDSLQAVRRHRYHDVLAEPGEADLSSHVDFAALSRAARSGGGAVHGPITQRALLRRLGVETRARHLMRDADAGQRAAIVAALRRLTDTDQMGALFKAIAIAPIDAPTPPAFED